MGISLKADQVPVLTAIQVDDNWRAIAGPPQLITIVGGVLTVNGAGVYKVETESLAATDDVTAIVGAWRAGDIMVFYQATAGHSVVWKNAGPLHLNGDFDFTMTSIYSNLQLRHLGSDVYAEELRNTNRA